MIVTIDHQNMVYFIHLITIQSPSNYYKNSLFLEHPLHIDGKTESNVN